jgi:hypothetical protein
MLSATLPADSKLQILKENAELRRHFGEKVKLSAHRRISFNQPLLFRLAILKFLKIPREAARAFIEENRPYRKSPPKKFVQNQRGGKISDVMYDGIEDLREGLVSYNLPLTRSTLVALACILLDAKAVTQADMQEAEKSDAGWSSVTVTLRPITLTALSQKETALQAKKDLAVTDRIPNMVIMRLAIAQLLKLPPEAVAKHYATYATELV